MAEKCVKVNAISVNFRKHFFPSSETVGQNKLERFFLAMFFSGLGKKGIKVSSTVSQLVEDKRTSLFSTTDCDEEKNIFIPLTPVGLYNKTFTGVIIFIPQ